MSQKDTSEFNKLSQFIPLLPLIGIASVWASVINYFYQLSHLHHYGVPEQFISLTPESIISTTILTSFFLMFSIFLGVNITNKPRSKIKTIRNIVLVTTNLCAVLTVITGLVQEKYLQTLLIIVPVAILNFQFFFNKKTDSKEKRKKENENSYYFWILTILLLTISTLHFAISLSQISNNSKSFYYIYTENELDYVLVAKSGENFIFSQVNLTKLELENKILIKSTDSDLKLSYKKIGTLRSMPNNHFQFNKIYNFFIF